MRSQLRILAPVALLCAAYTPVTLANSGNGKGGNSGGGGGSSTCSVSTAPNNVSFAYQCNGGVPSNIHPTPITMSGVGGVSSVPSNPGWGLGPVFSGTDMFALNIVGNHGPYDDAVLLVVVPTNLVSTMSFTTAGGGTVTVNASSFTAVALSLNLPGAANLQTVSGSLPLIGISTSSGLSIVFVDLHTAFSNGLQVTFSGVPTGAVIFGYGANGGTIVDGTPNSEAIVFGGSSPVPEPASIVLLGSGLLGIAARLRRRKTPSTSS